MKHVEIYDLESLSNYFSYYGINRETGEGKFFYVHEEVNQLDELREHLKGLLAMIGYNNLSYDYPLLHYILTSKKQFTAEELYKKSQEIINAEFSRIAEWNVLIRQIDLYLINHYDNVARSTSLKWLQFTQRWDKMQDMPFKHYDIIKKEDIIKLKEYNINDVLSTKDFYEKHCLKSITFRKNLSIKLNKDLLNYSDVKIGQYINQITYEKLTGRKFKEFKNKRTYHKSFKMIDIIPEGIFFKTKQLQDFLKELKTVEFVDQDVNRYLKFGNTTVKFAKGGLHSEDIPRIIKCKQGYILQEKDIAS